ncbi:MAG: ATP-binding protein [Paracoccaceae bacterium]
METLAAARRAEPGGMFFDSPPEAAFDRLTHLVTLTLGVPVSLLSLVDDQRAFYKSAVGLDAAQERRRGVDLDHSLCRHVVASGMRLVVDDARSDRRLAGSRSVLDLNIVAYAGVPVRAPNGRVIAALAAIDEVPRAWNARDVDVLEGLARSVESEFALRDRLTTSDAARRQADDLAETRRAIIDMCSHELRNPLNGIIGGVSLLRSRVDQGTRERVVGIIDEASRLMLDLIDKALTLEGGELGQPALDDVDLGALLAQRIETTRRMVRERDIAVRLAVADDFPAVVRGNDLLLNRIVGNLLDNAAKYTDRGTITLEAGREGADLVVRVVDTGHGIASNDVDRVFGRYERADARGGFGFGLGLAIAREAARALDGDVILESSAPGRGSVFVFRFPEKTTREA